MTRRPRALQAAIALAAAGLVCTASARAARVTLELRGGEGAALVGAVARWDQDGNHRRPPDANAKIDAPYVDHKATKTGPTTWTFADLPDGTYDLVIVAPARRGRVEGWTYVPVKEFDPFFPPDAKVKDAETRALIVDDIEKSRHFENKVEPLYLGGDEKTVRVLVMLIRDQPTSYTPGAGTIRHEIWQYTWNYGGWLKEKRTKVLDRVLMQVSDLRQWTWLWDAKLGGIEVKGSPLAIEYEMPKPSGTRELKGLYPY
jgi:hypothetical protein